MSSFPELYAIAESMAKKDIPDKLRCPGCDQILIGAFRLPCCDQQLCEMCHDKGPESCIVCGHEPLNCADLKPHKSSRVTIKAFLKSEEKKREQKRAQAIAKTDAASKNIPLVEKSSTTGPPPKLDSVSKAPDGNDEEETEAKKSASDASVNAFNSHQEQDGSGPNERTGDTDEKPDGTVLDSAPSSPSSSVEITLDYPNAPPERAFQSRSYSTAQDAVDLHSGPSGIQTPVVPEGRRDSRDQKPPFAQNTQDDRNDANDVNGGQSIQNWQNPGAFNSMMPISNGMNPAMYMQMQFMAWQNMGIDPMMAMSQGQFGGFNGQGFGMNGMNMSINGGFDGNYPAWNMGMNGDFGANAGFYPPGGYNQQMQHGQANHMQRAQYHNNYNQNRFRGRGNRRGLGRDQQNHAGRSQSNAGMPYTNADPSADRKDTQQGDATAAGHHTESQRLDADPADVLIHPGRQGLLQKAAQEQSADSVTTPKPLEQEETRDQQVHLETVTAEKEGTARQPGKPHRADHLPAEPSTDGDHGRKSSTATMLAAGPSQRDDLLLGDRLGSSAGEAAFQDRMPCRSTDANAVSDVTKLPPLPAASGTKAPGVSGAPTGPKAMREGLPNVGLRGRHGSQANNISSRNGIKPSIPQTPASNVILRPSSSSDSIRQQTSSKRGRSPSPDRSNKVARRRSPSAAPDDVDSVDHRKDRRPRHSHRHSRDRADSPASEEGHRSRHDRDKHRSSRRDRDREHSRERHRRKHRSRSPTRANGTSDMNGDDRSSRRESKYREREAHAKDDRRRSTLEDIEQSRRHRDTREDRDEKPRRDTKLDVKPTTPAASREFKIKDSSKRKQQEVEEKARIQHGDRGKRSEVEVQKEVVKAQNPDIDVYALEREASTRARMMKEQQRLQALKPTPALANSRKGSSAATEMGNLNGLNAPTGPSADMGGGSGRKRQRLDDGGRGGRSRKSFKYEDDEDADARASRIEREREAARFR